MASEGSHLTAIYIWKGAGGRVPHTTHNPKMWWVPTVPGIGMIRVCSQTASTQVAIRGTNGRSDPPCPVSGILLKEFWASPAGRSKCKRMIPFDGAPARRAQALTGRAWSTETILSQRGHQQLFRDAIHTLVQRWAVSDVKGKKFLPDSYTCAPGKL